jgi:hypothetical protein
MAKGARLPAIESILHHLVSRHSGRLGRIYLMKLCYLIDLEARRYLGAPVTDFHYRFHRLGPLTARFDRRLDGLVRKGRVMEKMIILRTTAGFEYHAGNGAVDLSPLSPGQRRILDHVSETYGRIDLAALIDLVFETAPMKAAKERQGGWWSPMAIVDGEARNAMNGVDLDRLAAGEAAAARGEVAAAGEARAGCALACAAPAAARLDALEPTLAIAVREALAAQCDDPSRAPFEGPPVSSRVHRFDLTHQGRTWRIGASFVVDEGASRVVVTDIGWIAPAAPSGRGRRGKRS